MVNNPVNNIDPDGYFHQVKKKKKRGFFRRFFGVFLVIAGIFTLQPELAALGAASATVEVANLANIGLGLANIAGGIASLASGTGGLNARGPPGSLGSPDFGLDLGFGEFLGEFFSPALRLAAEAGCDTCPDSRLDLLRVLLGLFQAAEAEAADTGVKPPPPWWPPRGRPGGIATPGGKNKPIEYRPPTEGQRRHWEDQFKQHGRKALEESKLSIQKNLEKEYRNLAEIYHKGGYPNPVERTILRQQNSCISISGLREI